MRRFGYIAGIITFVLFVGMKTACADAGLTKEDHQYLTSAGWKDDNAAIQRLTDPQAAYLHALINDPKMTSKEKGDKIDDFIESVVFDAAFDKFDKKYNQSPAQSPATAAAPKP